MALGAVCGRLAGAFGLLLPWATYTRAVRGHALLGSTNGGLASLIGFGVVPDNPWQITLSDDDAAVAGLLAARLGPRAGTMSFHADRLLRAEFVACVRQAPAV